MNGFSFYRESRRVDKKVKARIFRHIFFTTCQLFYPSLERIDEIIAEEGDHPE